MKKIVITYDREYNSPVHLIFLSGRFIAFYEDHEYGEFIAWSKESIEDLFTGDLLYWVKNPGESKYKNLSVNITDDDEIKKIDYEISNTGTLLKDGLELVCENPYDFIHSELTTLVEEFRTEWTRPNNVHYFYPRIEVTIYTDSKDYYRLNFLPWPTDEEYNFQKDRFYFYTGHQTWGRDYHSDTWFCSKSDFEETLRDILEMEEYFNTIPLGLDCLLINPLIPEKGEIQNDVISEIDEIRLYDDHQLITEENFSEKWDEIQEKCTQWIIDEIEHFIEWFEEFPFNIAKEFEENKRNNYNYWDNEPEDDLPEFIFPDANSELKAIVDKHIEEALKTVNTDQLTEKLNELSDYLEDADAMFNPKFNLVLDDKDFYMRSYIEDGRAWTWVKDGEDLDSPYLYFKEINLDSNEKEKRRYQSILDYFIDKSEMA